MSGSVTITDYSQTMPQRGNANKRRWKAHVTKPLLENNPMRLLQRQKGSTKHSKTIANRPKNTQKKTWKKPCISSLKIIKKKNNKKTKKRKKNKNKQTKKKKKKNKTKQTNKKTNKKKKKNPKTKQKKNNNKRTNSTTNHHLRMICTEKNYQGFKSISVLQNHHNSPHENMPVQFWPP